VPLRVVITRRLPTIAQQLLQARGIAYACLEELGLLSHVGIVEQSTGAAALLTTLRERVDRRVLDAAGESLRVVSNCAVGFDNIDVVECARRGIYVTNTPGVLTNATADLTWALILAVARRVVEGDSLVRSGGWTGWEPLQLCGLEFDGATLGIIGAGRIGSAVARRAGGFGMRILYVARGVRPELESACAAQRVSLDRVLDEADVVTIHLPLTDETRHLISEAQLVRMKPTAILVNTARGPIVDEEALVRALRSGQIAGAGLDVYEDEPRLSSGLADAPGVVLLPHLGSASVRTRERMARMAAENVISVLEGRMPPNPVNKPALGRTSRDRAEPRP